MLFGLPLQVFFKLAQLTVIALDDGQSEIDVVLDILSGKGRLNLFPDSHILKVYLIGWQIVLAGGVHHVGFEHGPVLDDAEASSQ